MAESNRIEYKRELTDNIEKVVVAFLKSREGKTIHLMQNSPNPQSNFLVTWQITPQVEALLSVMDRELSRTEIQGKLNLTDKKNFNENYLKPALEWNLIEMTVPGKPRSSLQKYRLTLKGETLKKQNTISKE